MPTYDAEKCKRLVASAMEPVGSRPWCDVLALADALLAATQEVERLRRLVGEACGIASSYSEALEPDDGACVLRGFGDDRLAAIRHAAGLGKDDDGRP